MTDYGESNGNNFDFSECGLQEIVTHSADDVLTSVLQELDTWTVTETAISLAGTGYACTGSHFCANSNFCTALTCLQLLSLLFFFN